MVHILIGTAGWSYDDWLGVFYPQKMKSGQYLAYFAKFFDYTEVNSTFYNLPNENVVQKWLNDVPETFRYSVKMWQAITHKKENQEGAIKAFFTRMKVLEPKVKGYLMQFPPYFKYSAKHQNQVVQLLDKIPTEKQIFMEFRDNAWFDPKVLSAFVDGEKVLLVTNYKEGVKPVYPDNQRTYYIRLIGDRAITKFDKIQRDQSEILEEVKQKLDSWERQPGIREVLITFNNHFRGFSPQDANEFRASRGLPYRNFKTALEKEKKKQYSLTDFIK